MVVRELKTLSDIEFAYTQESVEWLAGYIERLRSSGEFESVEVRNKLISMFGSYLGECIVRCYGGEWRQHEGVWGVAFTDGNMAFPYAKVAKQFDNGAVDDITSFFRIIPTLFAGRVQTQPAATRKPWWRFW